MGRPGYLSQGRRGAKIFGCFPISQFPSFPYLCCPQKAQVAKLVDAPSSGGGAARCAGSNPVLGTAKKYKTLASIEFGEVFCFWGAGKVSRKGAKI